MDEKELIKKYGLNIEFLKKEQIKLAKEISLKDAVDFSNITRFGAIDSIVIRNQIISVIIVCDKEYNIIEQQYFLDKLRFPYLREFRSYREIPAMMEAFNKLNEKPDVILINGHGITHPRLGIASHFSLLSGVPAVGIAESLFESDSIENGEIIKDGKKVGKVLQTKEKAKPLLVSPGNGLSVNSAYNLVKKLVKSPHKLPEPLHLAHRYAKEVQEELKL